MAKPSVKKSANTAGRAPKMSRPGSPDAISRAGGVSVARIKCDEGKAFGHASAGARDAGVEPMIALAEEHSVPCSQDHHVTEEFLWAETAVGMNSEDEFSVREIDGDFCVHVSAHEVHIQLGITGGCGQGSLHPVRVVAAASGVAGRDVNDDVVLGDDQLHRVQLEDLHAGDSDAREELKKARGVSIFFRGERDWLGRRGFPLGQRGGSLAPLVPKRFSGCGSQWLLKYAVLGEEADGLGAVHPAEKGYSGVGCAGRQIGICEIRDIHVAIHVRGVYHSY